MSRASQLMVLGMIVGAWCRPALGGPDDGNDCASATPLALGASIQTYERELEVGDPGDWFRVSGPAGRLVRVRMLQPGWEAEPRLRLLAADCDTVLDSADLVMGTREVRAIAASGILNIVFDTPPGHPGGVYRFSVEDAGPATDDAPDDPNPAARLVQHGETVSGRLDYTGDRDVFRFDLQPMTLMRIDAAAETPSGGVHIQVEAGDGAIGWAQTYPVFGSNGFTASSLFTVGPEVAMDSWIRVNSQWVDSAPGPYRFRLVTVETLPTIDDHGDSAETATPLEMGQSRVRSVLVGPGDEDWFTFPAQAHHMYRVEVWRKAGQGDHQIETQQPLSLAQPVSLHGGLASVPIYSEGAGAAYVRLFDRAAAPAVGLFEIGVRDLGEVFDDVPNTRDRAMALSADRSVHTGAIDYFDDRDWYRVPLEPSRLYRIEARGSGAFVGIRGPGFETPHGLYAASGGAGFAWRSATVVTPAGTIPVDYFIEVSDYSTGLYQLRIGDEGAIEIDARTTSCATTPASLPDGAPHRVFLTPQSPVAWLGWQVQPARRYRVVFHESTLETTRWPSARFNCDTPVAPPAEPWSNNAPDEFETTQPGQFQLAFGPSSSTASDSWVFGLQDVGAATDSIADTPATAAIVGVNQAPMEGQIDYHGDADYLRVRLRAGVQYRLEVQSVGQYGAWAAATVGLGSPGSSLASASGWRADGEGDSAWIGEDFDAPPDGQDLFIGVRAEAGNTTGYRVRIINPHCRADWNDSGSASLDDLFAYLTDWLAGGGDFDGWDGCTVGDLFEYLGVYFAGCD